MCATQVVSDSHVTHLIASAAGQTNAVWNVDVLNVGFLVLLILIALAERIVADKSRIKNVNVVHHACLRSV